MAHFDLDSNRWLALFADLNLLVVTFDSGTIIVLVLCFRIVEDSLHSAKLDDFLDTGDGVCLDGRNRSK